MTNPMLAELDAVVRLIERHDFLERLDAHDAATQLSLGFTQMAARFFRTHHATLADMAKDAARYRWLREIGDDFDHLPVFNGRGGWASPEFVDAVIDDHMNAAIDATQEGEG